MVKKMERTKVIRAANTLSHLSTPTAKMCGIF